jgi:hypothetical protein
MTLLADSPTVALLREFWVWVCAGNCIIKNRHGQLVPLVPNKLQRDMYEAMLSQALRGRPIRLILLKSRKMGCSTFIDALGYFLIKHYPHIYAQIVAHTDPSTRDIFEIAARMFVQDPQHPVRPKWPEGATVSFEDKHDSKLNIRTFGGQYASSSANIQFLHISELAKVAGDRQKVQGQLMSLFGAVADTPNTWVFIESTANKADESGEFQTRCETAERGEGSFAFVFSPWHDEPTYQIPGDEPLPPLRDADEAREEAELCERRPQLTVAQLRWRRQKIVDLGGLINFKQEYPDNPEEAFQVASGKVFPALRRTRHGAQIAVAELAAQGYRFYRAVDWGGADPFVCLWIANHRNRPTAFSVDLAACPNLWREMSTWTYDDHGRPRDRDNHGIDAVRYGVTFFDMAGHVHVFREIYDPNFAARGEWVADNAHAVLDATGDLEIAGSVGDRGRPDCLNAFCAQGVPISGYQVPGLTGSGSEVLGGIDRLNQLIVASYPLAYPPPPPTPTELHRRRKARTGLTFGVGSLRALQESEEARLAHSGPCPWGAQW